MRMRLTETPGHVQLGYDDEDGERVERHFIQTHGLTSEEDKPRYVRERLSNGDTVQVCERLASSGNTLMSTSAALSAVIRRHYRAMRAEWRRPFCGRS